MTLSFGHKFTFISHEHDMSHDNRNTALTNPSRNKLTELALQPQSVEPQQIQFSSAHIFPSLNPYAEKKRNKKNK